MNTDTEKPSIDAQNEISLKTTNAISILFRDLQRGLITRAEVKTAIRALFDAVGGMISLETFELLSEAADSVKGAVGFDVRFIRHGRLIVGNVRTCGGQSHIMKFTVDEIIKPTDLSIPSDMEMDIDAVAMLRQDEITKGAER